MNIFYLDQDPNIAARYHVDKHVVKMILESAQLLSTAHHIAGSNPEILERIYKATHYNHPSAIWVRENKANYQWLFELFLALLNEYHYRFGKTHKSSELIPFLKEAPLSLPEAPFFPPTPTMDEEYLIDDNSLLSYRNYYKLGKSHLFAWTKREKPDWLN